MVRGMIRSPGKACTEVEMEGRGERGNNYAASVSSTSAGGTFP